MMKIRKDELKMELMQKLEKYNNEDWTLFDGAQKQFEKTINSKRGYMTESNNLSEEGDFLLEGYDDNDVLNDIDTVKDVMVYSEINSFKEKLLSDMNEEERSTVIPRIIGSLSALDAPPMAYVVKDESIKLAWYLNNILLFWSLSDTVADLSNE
jgi:hypothetical protein